MKWFRIVAVITLTLMVGVGFGQTTVSPYSSSGLGELAYPGMPHNIAMGEVGIATPSYWSINTVNPALLANNQLTTFQVGFQGDYRNFSTSNTSQSNGTGGLRFLSLALPVKPRRWASSVGLTPYSTVNYNFFETVPVPDTDFTSRQAFEGEGGLTRLDWANGIRLSGKFLVGFKASYVFGSIRKSSRSIVAGDDSPFSIRYNVQESYRDFIFQMGAFYKIALTDTKGFNVGATYSPSITLNGTRDENFTRVSAGTPIATNEINEDLPAQFDLPHEIGLGVAYEDLNHLTIGLDVTLTQGGEYAADPENFRETLRISAGMEFIPDYSSVRSYFQRISYRAGVSFVQLPYIAQGQDINDFGVSFGSAFPISGLSTIDTAFKFGWRGSTQEGLIRENYVQFVFGITINDRWFIKRRYD